MIVTLTGDNDFAATQTKRDLITRFMAKYGEHGVEQIEAETLEAHRLPDLLQGGTLFTPARLVVLKNISANKAIQEPLLALLPSVPADTTLVIVDAKLDKRTKLYSFLKANTEFKDFAPSGSTQLAAWAQKTAAELGGMLTPGDAHYLVERTGRDQWRLASEVEKLVHFEPQITRECIDDLVEASPEGTAFDLLDAALAGNRDKTAKVLEQLKVAEDPYKFFGLLASQVHALVLIAASGGKSPDVIAKESGLHPFVVRKTQSVARHIGQAEAQRLAAAVALCDTQLKSTGVDPWQLIGAALQKVAVSQASSAS